MRRFLWIAFLVAFVPAARADVLNPGGFTYDGNTGRFYNPDGSSTNTPPPITDYMKNNGYSQDPVSGTITDPKGLAVDPSKIYPSPSNTPSNPGGVTYDPKTKNFYDADGNQTTPPSLPDAMQDRGFRQDPASGEVMDPEGDPVDPATLYPAPSANPGGVTYDPNTGKYYAPAGNECPAPDLPDSLKDQGYTQNPSTGTITDPNGNTVPPSQVFPPPGNNPAGQTYDPQTGKYYDGNGNPQTGELPPHLQDQGYTIDPITGKITGPGGQPVDPSTFFPLPPQGPGGLTYDPVTGKYYDANGNSVPIPDLPPYMQARGWTMHPSGGELRGPDGKPHDPNTFYPKPTFDPGGFYYDPKTGKFYNGDGVEVPPYLPQWMRDRGWRWDPKTGTFVDPTGKRVKPSKLFPPPKGKLPAGVRGTPQGITQDPFGAGFGGGSLAGGPALGRDIAAGDVQPMEQAGDRYDDHYG